MRVLPPAGLSRVIGGACFSLPFVFPSQHRSAWWIPTGGHIQGHVVAPHEYERRVIEFLDRSLR